MNPGNWAELLAVLGAFVGSSFALARMVLAQQRASTDRFVEFLEGSLQKQDATIDGFRDSVGAVTQALRENTRVVRRVGERLHVDLNGEGSR
jgi:hypothetical protein